MMVSRTRNAKLTFAIVFSIGLFSSSAMAQTANSLPTDPVAVDVHALDGASMGPALAPPATERQTSRQTTRQTSRNAARSAARKTRAAARRAARPQPASAAVRSSGSNVVAEARRWIGTNPTGRARLWCAHFMNFVLERTGRSGTGSGLARSFARYGTRVSGPKVGAIAVMSRGRRGGHVGVVSGISDKGDPIVISGNYGRQVAEATIPRGRVFAYVMPEG